MLSAINYCSIHKQLQKLGDLTNQIKTDDRSLLDDLFEEWGFAPWLKELCKRSLYVLIVTVTMLVIAPCVLHCALQMTNKTIKEVFSIKRQGEMWEMDL